MAYEKTVWQAGDTVTAAKLNKLENGVAMGGAVYIPVTINEGEQTASINYSYNEIAEIINEGATIIFTIEINDGISFFYVSYIAVESGSYLVGTNEGPVFYSESADEPLITSQGDPSDLPSPQGPGTVL